MSVRAGCNRETRTMFFILGALSVFRFSVFGVFRGLKLPSPHPRIPRPYISKRSSPAGHHSRGGLGKAIPRFYFGFPSFPFRVFRIFRGLKISAWFFSGCWLLDVGISGSIRVHPCYPCHPR